MTMIKQKCDFCNQVALYDGKTQMGPWAFMCEKHFTAYGFPALKDLYTVLEQPETPPNKICSSCNLEKPVTEFYEYVDYRGVKRYRTECKACNLAIKKRNSFK